MADGGGAGVVPIAAQGTALHAADLGAGSGSPCPTRARLHVFVARGQVMLGERLLEPGRRRPAASTRAAATRRPAEERRPRCSVWASLG